MVIRTREFYNKVVLEHFENLMYCYNPSIIITLICCRAVFHDFVGLTYTYILKSKSLAMAQFYCLWINRNLKDLQIAIN